jgi:hypothetical protein
MSRTDDHGGKRSQGAKGAPAGAAISPRLLMRFHDGEASDEQARQVEERLRAAPAAAAELESMAAVGHALRDRSRRAIEQQSFDGFFARVERGLREARPLTLRERLIFRLREWFRPWAVWPAAAAAGVALAALVAIGMHNGNGQRNDCTIESLNYSGAAGAIFLIPDDKGTGNTTVVWTNETEETNQAEAH